MALAVAAPRLVAETRAPAGRAFDLAGVALLTAALALAIDAMLRARSAPGVAGAEFAASAALAVLFFRRQRRQPDPMLDPRVFTAPAMAAVGALLLALSLGYWALLVYLPLSLGAALRWNAEQAGLGLLAATLSMLVLPPLGARLVTRWGWRPFFALSLRAVAVGNLVLLLSTHAAADGVRMAAVLAGMATIRVGAALADPQLSGAVLALALAEQTSMASAVTVIARQAGFAVGIAPLGAALTATDSAAGFTMAFALCAMASAIGLLAALALLPRRDAGAAGRAAAGPERR